MFIKKVTLTNVRCLKEFDFSFDRAGSSILLLGDNGGGKSTVIKSLAIGLCDESSASALFRELPGEFVRRKIKETEVTAGKSGSIEIELERGDGYTYVIRTTITSLSNFERVNQELFKYKTNGKRTEKSLNQDNFPWEDIFVVAYGPGGRTQATSDFQHYLAVDAVYPLFNYSSPLQNPELVIHRILHDVRTKSNDPVERDKEEAKVLSDISRLMADLLDLDSPECFHLTSTGIKVSGYWGTAELSELSDGYQSVINWVLDLVSWWFLSGHDEWDISALKGIVLIDEIEQHLHPKWQRTLFPRLREKFPNIQFIVATHSPLVASANPDVDVCLLSRGVKKIIQPFGWLAEDMYDEMGLSSSRSVEFEETVLSRYSELMSKSIEGNLTKAEKIELRDIKKRLQSMPESDPIGLSLEIQSMTESLKKLQADKE